MEASSLPLQLDEYPCVPGRTRIILFGEPSETEDIFPWFFQERPGEAPVLHFPLVHSKNEILWYHFCQLPEEKQGPRYPVFSSSNILLSIFTLPFLRIRSYQKNFPAHGKRGLQEKKSLEVHV